MEPVENDPPRTPFSIIDLPFDVVYIVASLLGLENLFPILRSCKHFANLSDGSHGICMYIKMICGCMARPQKSPGL
jgi:hypothetical protein